MKKEQAMEKEKDIEKEKKLHRVCVFLNDEEFQALYKVVYKEKTIPSKVLRKALMGYIEKSLLEESEDPIIW
jgi:hypothetical protein